MRLIAIAGFAGALGCLAQAQLVTVPAGSKISLKLTSALSTRTSRPGDAVRAETAFPVAVGGNVAIPTGTYVEGAIDKVRRSGRKAGFDVHFARLIFANGYTVPLTGSSTVPGAPASGVAAGPAPPDAAPAGMASHLQAEPGLTPPPSVGPSKGLIIGIGATAAATAIVTAVLLGRRGGGLYLDAGSALEMVLTSPLPLDAAKLSAGAAGATP